MLPTTFLVSSTTLSSLLLITLAALSPFAHAQTLSQDLITQHAINELDVIHDLPLSIKLHQDIMRRGKWSDIHYSRASLLFYLTKLTLFPPSSLPLPFVQII